MNIISLREVFENPNNYFEKDLTVCGWIKTNRDQKTFGFITLSDGTCFNNLQIVYDTAIQNFDNIKHFRVGSSIICKGKIIETPGSKQAFEMQASEIILHGDSSEDYPLQPKKHTFEYLRTIQHLRPRTNTFQAVFRVRSLAAFAIHSFFQGRGFVYTHTPIITSSDCEGAGEMFQVTTLDLERVAKEGLDYSKDFFGKKVSLTVSGQLDVENFAQAFRNVYTFGPTFRAENSNTTRHAAEFWMIEPEMAFCDLEEDMDIAEAMLKYVIKYVLEKAPEEMKFFNERIDNSLIDRLNNIVNSNFERITYTDAIKLLEEHNSEFEYKVSWGCDLQTEHERFITEKIYKKPVFVTHYPKEIKAFYMKLDPDGKTVAACDCLVPGIGEIIGGSQREENYDVLLQKMKDFGLNIDDYKNYLDLRKYGTTVHSGFGLGFERLIMYLTGISNIRDVLPYPRCVGYCN